MEEAFPNTSAPTFTTASAYVSLARENLTRPKTAPQASQLMATFILGAQVRNSGIAVNSLILYIWSISNLLSPISESDHSYLPIANPQSLWSDPPPSALH